MRKYLLIACLFLLCQKSFLLAQIDTIVFKEKELIQEDDFMLQLENLAEEAEEEQDYSEIIEEYAYYRKIKSISTSLITMF